MDMTVAEAVRVAGCAADPEPPAAASGAWPDAAIDACAVEGAYGPGAGVPEPLELR
jgi:hypothetical protein